MPALQYNTSCTRGTDFSRVFIYQDENRDPVDFTGWGVRFRMSRTLCSETTLESEQTDVDDPSAAQGFLTWFLDEDLIATLELGSYWFTIDLVSPVGDVNPFIEGYLEVMPEEP